MIRMSGPFWSYYGGKYRAAPRYPKPLHRCIIEPFSGAAGYSMRYPDHDVILIEKYAVVAEMWRFLIAATARDILDIPTVDHVDDLPASVPQGARYLVGFCLNSATVSPCRKLSAGVLRLRATGRKMLGWNATRRERVAKQVAGIKHWKIVEGSYDSAPDVAATWFVDPPYNNKAGGYYVHSALDYAALAGWCQERQGQVMVCENDGATWLPFKSFGVFKAGTFGRAGSSEVLWYADTNMHLASARAQDNAGPDLLELIHAAERAAYGEGKA